MALCNIEQIERIPDYGLRIGTTPQQSSASGSAPSIKMPGLIRKLIVFATIDGLVIQPSGHGDQSAALRIDYKSHRPVSWGPSPLEIYRKNTPLETHGIIGGEASVICCI